MTTPDHQCWWTRHRTTDLTLDGNALSGSGVPLAVLRNAATALSSSLTLGPADPDDETYAFSIGDGTTGSIHDGCFFHVTPSSPVLVRAVLTATLELHKHYLKSPDWTTDTASLLSRFRTGYTLRLTAVPRRGTVVVRLFPVGASFLHRLLAPAERLHISSTPAPPRAA